MKAASYFANSEHRGSRTFFLGLGIAGLAWAGLGLSWIIYSAIRAGEFAHFVSEALLLFSFIPGMLAGALSVEMLIRSCSQGRLATFAKTFFPLGLVAAGFGIVVTFRFHPGVWFCVTFGVTIYSLLLMGAVITAASIARGHR